MNDLLAGYRPWCVLRNLRFEVLGSLLKALVSEGILSVEMLSTAY
jgi:hypothetical protein